MKLLYKENWFSPVKKETVLNIVHSSKIYFQVQSTHTLSARTDGCRKPQKRLKKFPMVKGNFITSLQLQPLSGTAHFQILVPAEVQRPNFPASIWDISDVPSAKASTAFVLQFKFFLCLIQRSSIINGMDEWQNGNYESVHLITS